MSPLKYSAKEFNPTTAEQRWYAAFDGELVVGYALFAALPGDSEIRLLDVGAYDVYGQREVQQRLLSYALHDLRVKQADSRRIVDCSSPVLGISGDAVNTYSPNGL
jgi:hypothetical protein